MKEMGPALDEATRVAQEAGVELTGTFATLAGFREKVLAHEDIVNAAEALNSVFTALRSTAGLTQETFTAFSAELQTTFKELTDGGFTSNEALSLLAPTLLQIQKAAEDGRITVDEGTQALIDQADTAGLFDNLKDPMQELVEIMKLQLEVTAQLAKAFGGTLPAEVQKYIDSLHHIPTIPDVPGMDGGGDNVGNDNPRGEVPLAGGGIAMRPTHALVGEAGPEAVIPLDELSHMMATNQNSQQPASGPETIIIQNTLDLGRSDQVIMRRIRGKFIRVNQ